MLNLCNLRPAPAHVLSLLNKIDDSTRILNWLKSVIDIKNLFALSRQHWYQIPCFHHHQPS